MEAVSVPLINTQPREAKELHPDGCLDVVGVWKTIQGEGPKVGTPAVFVRLAGCNLQCPRCDTDYTSNRQVFTPADLVRRVAEVGNPEGGLRRRTTLVVVTGGEPFRQNLTPFVRTLIANGHSVQVETNGTMDLVGFPFGSPAVMVVCSPKTPGVHPNTENHADAWKYVIQAGQVDETDGLPSTALCGAYPARPPASVLPDSIYVQPLDEQDEARNALNTKAAVDSCMRHGYRLCLQVHKIVGLE